MGSPSTPKLPLIDFCKNDMKPGSTDWDSVQKEVVKALEEYGCFEARYENIGTELHDDVFKQLEDWFNLPAETKCTFVDPGKVFDGYLTDRPDSPLYEGMGITAVLDSSNIEKLASLMWPQGNPKFCEALSSFAVKLSELESLITRMVFRSLGVEKYLDSHAKSLNHSIRATRYGVPVSQETGTGGRAHFDKGFLTFLQQKNHVNGLEVQTKDGQWFLVAPSASTVIVMTGESFLGWSNGRFHCPLHQVIMRGNEVRYSAGLFSAIRGVVECPPELVDEQHPLLFKPFDELDLLQLYATEQVIKTESTLETFWKV